MLNGLSMDTMTHDPHMCVYTHKYTCKHLALSDTPFEVKPGMALRHASKVRRAATCKLHMQAARGRQTSACSEFKLHAVGKTPFHDCICSFPSASSSTDVRQGCGLAAKIGPPKAGQAE